MTDRTFFMYAPTVAVTKKARQRRPSLASAIKQAGKAGVNVAGATLNPDGSVALEFGRSVPADTERLNEWDEVLTNAKN